MEQMIQIYKDQIEVLQSTLNREREDKIRLQDQVDRLQEGLMAVRAPQAYQDQRMDRLGWEDPNAPTPEEIEERGKRKEIVRRYISNIEEPLFKDTQEMVDMLQGTILRSTDLTPKPLRNDSES